MKIENEKIRFEGFQDNLIKVKMISSGLFYLIEISFKDNKYKFEVLTLLEEERISDYKLIPNFKTDPKYIKNFGKTPQNIENYLNGLNLSLKNYILELSKNEDW